MYDICVHVCRGHRVTSGVILQDAIHLLRDESLTWSSPIRIDCLESESQAASGLHFPPSPAPPGITNAHYHTQHFYMISGD